MTLEADVQQGWHDAIVEMFDVDLTLLTGDAADIFYFTNQLKEDGTKIQWKGNIYEPLPILAAGYDKNTNGQIAQPSLTVANVLGTFTQVVASYDDLVGGKVTRRRTLQKYLDGSPQADPLQEFPIDIFYIERKTQETSLAITWQLSSVLDLEGVRLPRRVITQNLCLWRYRGSECGYTGAPVFNSRDQVISTTGKSAQAVAVINGWYLREQRKAELQAATQAYNQALGVQDQACDPLAFTLLETRYNRKTLPFSFVRRNADGDEASERYSAVFNGLTVSIDETFRQGRQRETTFIGGLFFGGVGKSYFYEIERWGYDPAACAAAGVVVATTTAALTTAQNNLNSAEAALSAAIAALPANDALRLEDVCGKRVSSCALHFPEQSLPFGGFPGANVTRR
jgi:lambda family phage minor tail protein L